ncbi:MAG TPA: hypothetical protein VE077_13780 [Candidatus Methylomirabilis sp.]|nr:hypothetical protein [Candidatus Methylomirabilis sp.]
MKLKRKFAERRHKESGYALLLVVFFATLVLIGTMSIGLRVLTEGRRQKEQDMIWRGQQYTRGIKLFYRKYGRFPTSLDDLTKPGLGNIRFMRQAYKDPMNKEDGSWRLIYVGPAGQLIGSLKPQQGNLQMPAAGALGQPAAGGPGQSGVATGFGGFGAATNPAGGISAGGTASGTSTPGTGATTTTPGAGAQSTDTTGTGTDQPIPTGDTPTIVGGNIIGVGGKVNQSSIIVYEKAKNYRLFEFIWDPSKDMGIVGGAPGTVLGMPSAAPGQNPMGVQPGQGTGQPQNPPPQNPQNPPNPNPNPNPNP